MEEFTLESFSFTYPAGNRPALENISLSVKSGEFLVVCGPSGSGKSTLLRQLKPSEAAAGTKSGNVLFEGRPLEALSRREESSAIGFVSQSAENRLVCDKVWHELAFGLESLGLESDAIRRRVVEMASFFGISSWYYRDTASLSGGQKQLLSLASVMVMQPKVLILDEPTAQLDPVASGEFLSALARINRELGTTVIMTEHRLEEAFSYADRAVLLDEGRLVCCAKPPETGEYLRKSNSPMFLAMPCAMRAWAASGSSAPCPVSVREGRQWLETYSRERKLAIPAANTEKKPAERPACSPKPGEKNCGGEISASCSEVCFRYEKDGKNVANGLSLKVGKGEISALLGENGSGKSTALKLLCGILKPQRGSISVSGRAAMLPQDPCSLFVKSTVEEDLRSVLAPGARSQSEKDECFEKIVRLCGLSGLLKRNPFDLSGGEQQRAGLAKVLLTGPDLLLLDEPTKALDAGLKEDLADILETLKKRGTAILMVSHDVEFCAEHADRCALFFDGGIVSEDEAARFFLENTFYTTAAGRMTRGIADGIVRTSELERACGGRIPVRKSLPEDPGADRKDGDDPDGTGGSPKEQTLSAGQQCGNAPSPAPKTSAKLLKRKKLPERTVFSLIAVLLMIPATLILGTVVFSNVNTYFLLLIVLLECMAPFFMAFEGRKPRAHELVLLASLVAIGVAGRAIFFMLPEFKPVIAITVIAGAALGAESGFLTGALVMLVSNLIFGHGPWTPWQMFAMGLIGFISGLLFSTGILGAKRLNLAVFGAFSSIVIYGGIMNPVSALMWMPEVTFKALLPYYAAGLPMDCLRAFSAAVFLFLAGEPFIEKLARVLVKYGA